MSAPTGLVSFRPNLLHNYHDQSEKVPFRPGVFQGYQVKPWYIPAEGDTAQAGDSTNEGDGSVEGDTVTE